MNIFSRNDKDVAVLAAVATNLAALDFSIEARQLTEVNQELAEARSALHRGRVRLEAIPAEMRRLRENGPDGDAAAASLRAGEEVTTIAGSIEGLEIEKETIRAGVRVLHVDIARLEGDREVVKDTIARKMSAAFEVSVADYATRAGNLINELAQIFADLSTIRSATNSRQATNTLEWLRPMLSDLNIKQIVARDHSADEDLVSLLREHKDVIDTFDGRIRPVHSF